MAHYAFLDKNNVVTEVIVGKNETELIDGVTPEQWYGNFRGQVCVRTSYNHNIRKQYAGIGYTYDATADVFILASPFPSWVLDSHYDWVSPLPMPTTDGRWLWNEETLEWTR